MFAREIYIQRRERLRAQVQSGLILLLGNDESPMNYAANAYPFRQDSTFLYFFGLDQPGLAAVIDVEEGTECVFGDDPTVEEIVWTGPRAAAAGQMQPRGRDAHGCRAANCSRSWARPPGREERSTSRLSTARRTR